MTIQVVCECGFHKEVPDQWKGMRVKCKCGRSFVISAEGGIQEPPVAAPPVQHAKASPAATNAPPEPDTPAPSDNALGISPQRTRDSVAARYHARHDPADFRKRLILWGGAVVALICLGALTVVLRDKFPSGWKNTAQTKTSATEKQPTVSKGLAKVDSTDTSPASATDRAQGATGPQTAGESSDLSDETGRLRSRIAEAIELDADDGLLLTGIFGAEHEQLEYSEEQSAKIEELANQLRTKEKELISGEMDLEQWYVDGEKIGNELLAVLTDQQRARLREMIEQEKIARIRLEEYAARLRPELKTPIVSWKIEPDGTTLPVITQCAVAGPTNGDCVHTASASGAFAFASSQSSGMTYELWDLVTDKRIGSCTVPPPSADGTTIVAQGGRSLVRGTKSGDGGYRVQVWSVDSSAAPKIMDLPRQKGSDAAAKVQLVGCVANRVLCVSSTGYWVWNLDTDDTREVTFPDWVPHDMPKCAISPGGQYVAMAHRHGLTIESKQYHFLEVGIYELETGDLLGNQVVATDYRPFDVAAIALSYNGRELALLWDIDSPEPERLLIHMSAIDGRLIETVKELPTARQGYARQHNLHQRDLIWLPDSSGWVVNLQSLVESESGSVIDIELPKSRRAGEADKPALKNIIEAIPAGNNRLLLITIEPANDDPSSKQIQSQFIELPEMGPFM